MPAANALRIQIEHALEQRFPAALSPVQCTIRETAPTGVAEVDGLFDGGLPVGAISEVTGPECSGRTTLALSFLAGQTREGRVCAWVDAGDAFDAESAAASGVSLKQLLWVRCRSASGMAKDKPWTRLDQALRATDLLLQAGGFAAIVLDLGGTASEHASRIPLASWFRFRQAAGRTRCSLVVLGQEAYAQSSAAVVLECAPLRAKTQAGTALSGFTYEVRRGRVAAAAFTPAIAGMRKPPASASMWAATGAWDGEKRGPQRQVLVAEVQKRGPHRCPEGAHFVDGVEKRA